MANGLPPGPVVEGGTNCCDVTDCPRNNSFTDGRSKTMSVKMPRIVPRRLVEHAEASDDETKRPIAMFGQPATRQEQGGPHRPRQDHDGHSQEGKHSAHERRHELGRRWRLIRNVGGGWLLIGSAGGRRWLIGNVGRGRNEHHRRPGSHVNEAAASSQYGKARQDVVSNRKPAQVLEIGGIGAQRRRHRTRVPWRKRARLRSSRRRFKRRFA